MNTASPAGMSGRKLGKTAVAVKQFEPTFIVDDFGWVIATQPNGGKFKTQSVEAHLLYAILQLLENAKP